MTARDWLTGAAARDALSVVAFTSQGSPGFAAGVLGPSRPPARTGFAALAGWFPAAAAAVLVAGLILLGDGPGPVWQWWLALVPVAGLVISVRRPVLGWRILLVWQVVLVSWVAVTGADDNPLILVGVWGWWPTMYAATRWSEVPARVGILCWSLLVTALTWGRPDAGGAATEVIASVAVPVALGWTAGLADRARARAQVEQVRADRSELTTAVLQERARIARELHDVVSHRVAVIAVRCESARYRLAGMDDAVQCEFVAIAEDAREAMRELREVLSVLREQASGSAAQRDPVVDRRPAPGVADLPDAVQRAVDAGAGVDLELDQQVAGLLSAGQELAVYRVVTQALANALEHAPGAAVRIAVRADHHGHLASLAAPCAIADGADEATAVSSWAPITQTGDQQPRGAQASASAGPGSAPAPMVDQVCITITNTAPPETTRRTWTVQDRTGSDAAVPARGSGIVGMRERIELHGGRLQAVRTPLGGFEVSVWLPLRDRGE